MGGTADSLSGLVLSRTHKAPPPAVFHVNAQYRGFPLTPQDSNVIVDPIMFSYFCFYTSPKTCLKRSFERSILLFDFDLLIIILLIEINYITINS